MEKLGGAWPTMVTPFAENGRIDWGAYRRIVEWYIAMGVGGVYANCLSSEMYQLSDSERVRLAREAVDVAAGRIPVAATGNLGEGIEAHLELCRHLAGVGVDIVMLVVPRGMPKREDLAHYYATMAERLDTPLGLYECPVPRRFHLPDELVGELADSGRFVAYKETSENLDRIRRLIARTQSTPLSVLQACNAYLLDSVRAGGLGSMSIAAIHLPDLLRDIIAKGLAGDPDAERLQRLLSAIHLAQRCCHPQGTKYLLAKRGLPITARCRASARPLSAETRLSLDQAAQIWFRPDGALRGL